MIIRKKPITLDAWRAIDLSIDDEVPVWVFNAMANRKINEVPNGGWNINTLEGKMHANLGDVIVRGVDGELYPIREDIFKRTYDVVGGDEHGENS
ncbi:hypothetical protein [Levilactobacillus acidifarinae]|uniref:hypothetical protein n=1 Tax=Levilactobacillus acidifarinae TaxID=267364 RepID=UPI00070A58A5|nr:hypothetical protein [Levilactobacillus acidifarinae]GEO70519.1 hypothetical protein LAC03_24290 [Levilactobacillus acidifarinae]